MGERAVSESQADRTVRLGKNEALFRSVNEQIDALNEYAARAKTFAVVCECGYLSCSDTFQIGRSVYEAVRSESNRFLVKSDHVIDDVETVFTRYDGFVVVVKDPGLAEQVADELNPRG